MHEICRLATLDQRVFEMTQLYIFSRNFTVINPTPLNTVKKIKLAASSTLWTVLLFIAFAWIVGNARAAAGFPIKPVPPVIRPRVLMIKFDDSGIEL